MADKSKAKHYAGLYIVFFLYSISSVCSKLASSYAFPSFYFVLFYGLAVLVLGVYAIFWQQILKCIPLVTAYANKSVTIILGMLWGALLFGEPITWNMILGTAIIVVGVYLVVSADE